MEINCTFQQSFSKRRRRTRSPKLILNTSLRLKRYPAVLAELSRSRKTPQNIKLDLRDKEGAVMKQHERLLRTLKVSTEKWLKYGRDEKHFLSPKLIRQPAMGIKLVFMVYSRLPKYNSHSRDDTAGCNTDKEYHFGDDFQILLVAH